MFFSCIRITFIFQLIQQWSLNSQPLTDSCMPYDSTMYSAYRKKIQTFAWSVFPNPFLLWKLKLYFVTIAYSQSSIICSPLHVIAFCGVQNALDSQLTVYSMEFQKRYEDISVLGQRPAEE
jgi:hypothetical protein